MQLAAILPDLLAAMDSRPTPTREWQVGAMKRRSASQSQAECNTPLHVIPAQAGIQAFVFELQ